MLYTEKLFPLHLTKSLSAGLAWVGSTNALCERAMASGTVLRCYRCYGSWQLLPPKNGHHWGLHAFYESEKDEKTEVPAAPLWKGCNESAEFTQNVERKKKKNMHHAEKEDNTKKWVKNGMSSMWLSMLSLFALRLGHIETNVGPGGDSVWAHLVT